MVLKRGNFGEYFRNTWKCGAGKGLRSSLGPLVLKTKNITQSQGGEEYLTNYKKEGRLTLLVTSCVETAF
jgi:hypothetical protein